MHLRSFDTLLLYSPPIALIPKKGAEYAQRQVCVLFGRRSAYIILCAQRTLRFSPVRGEALLNICSR